ncbi:MAG: CPBP family intramembrane metalloprotease [Methanosarcinaceae archaeon]|nr:CPBP family intramembrane metalloprotease [Methanosarcinaceae archaeon]
MVIRGHMPVDIRMPAAPVLLSGRSSTSCHSSPSGCMAVYVIIIFQSVGSSEGMMFRAMPLSWPEDPPRLNAALSSILFCIMHSGGGIFPAILPAAPAVSVPGYMFRKTRSLPHVILAYSLAGIFLYAFIPVRDNEWVFNG